MSKPTVIFTCRKCGWQGDCPHERLTREVLGGPEDRFYFDCEVFCCPQCMCDELDHRSACDECGKNPAAKGSDCCQLCDDKFAREEATAVAEFSEPMDAYHYMRSRGRGYTVTAGLSLPFAVRRIA